MLAFAVAGKGKDFSLPAGQGISLPATKSVADEKQFSLPATESVAGKLKMRCFFLPATLNFAGNLLCYRQTINTINPLRLEIIHILTFFRGLLYTLRMKRFNFIHM